MPVEGPGQEQTRVPERVLAEGRVPGQDREREQGQEQEQEQDRVKGDLKWPVPEVQRSTMATVALLWELRI